MVATRTVVISSSVAALVVVVIVVALSVTGILSTENTSSQLVAPSPNTGYQSTEDATPIKRENATTIIKGLDPVPSTTTAATTTTTVAPVSSNFLFPSDGRDI